MTVTDKGTAPGPDVVIVMGVSARPGEELFFGNTATRLLGETATAEA